MSKKISYRMILCIFVEFRRRDRPPCPRTPNNIKRRLTFAHVPIHKHVQRKRIPLLYMRQCVFEDSKKYHIIIFIPLRVYAI